MTHTFDYTIPTHFVRLLSLRGTLHLESKGIQMTRTNATKAVKAEFGFSGKTTTEILSQMEDFIEAHGHDLGTARYTPRVITETQMAVLKSLVQTDTYEEYTEDQAQFAVMLSGFSKAADRKALHALEVKGLIFGDDINGEDMAIYLTEKGFQAATTM